MQQQQVNKKEDLQIGKKIKKAFYCTMLFAILSYHGSYKLVGQIISTLSTSDEQLVDDTGHPSIKAIIIQMLIFFFITMVFIM